MYGKAAVFKGAGVPVEIQEFPLPEVEPGAILVKTRMATICGSDIHRWLGKRPDQKFLPSVMGHEGMGEVYELGGGVTKDSIGKPLAVGDRIIFSYFQGGCGRCYYCLLKKQPILCENKKTLGIGNYQAGKPPYFTGTFAEYIYVPPLHYVLKVPDNLSDDVVAPINCAMVSVMSGLTKARVEVGDSVAVQGVGGLGLYAVLIAKEMGATRIIAIDRSEARLELAQEFGADLVINIDDYASVEERIQKARELTDGRGPDLVADVTGVPAAFPEGLQMTSNGGRHVLWGIVFPHGDATIDLSWIVGKALTIMGSNANELEDLRKALELAETRSDRYPWEKMISRKFKLEEVNEAFKIANERKEIRVAIIP